MDTLINKDTDAALKFLNDGKLVAVPTETVYGLAADYRNEKAIQRIFRVKKRPAYDPLILHASDIQMIEGDLVKEIPGLAKELAEAFWPGPLTLILPKKENVSDLITSGLPTVGVRIPGHPLLLELIKKLDRALAAPSANPFGYISPTSAEHVEAQLGGKIPMILDGGPASVGLESTILAIEGSKIKILRRGIIEEEQLKAFSGQIITSDISSSRPEAPGMLDKHYSPRKNLFFADEIAVEKINAQNSGGISFSEYLEGIPHENQIILSPEKSLEIAARRLYAALREMDQSRFRQIVTEKFPETGLGLAINDRLKRAVTRK